MSYGSIWKPHKNLYAINRINSVCPHCSSDLHKDYTLIPIKNKSQQAKIYGEYCIRCDVLYINNNCKRLVCQLLADNKDAAAFRLNGKSLVNFTEMKNRQAKKDKYINIMKNTNSAVIALFITDNDTQLCYVIVNDKKDEDIPNNILHYTNDHARKLLTYCFYKHTRSDNKNKVTYYNNPKNNINCFMPKSIYIIKDGGNYSSTIDTGHELVDLLCFSEITNQYEILRATYNKKADICYVDSINYRIFKSYYGEPQNTEICKYKDIYDNLNAESVLKKHGYSVSIKAKLTSAQRQKILANIIDNKILSVSQIVEHLNFCISTHAFEKDLEARNKWNDDKEFVTNYKVNVTRFLISEKPICQTHEKHI